MPLQPIIVPHSSEQKSLPIEQAPFKIIGLENVFPLVYSYFIKYTTTYIRSLFDIQCAQVIVCQ